MRTFCRLVFFSFISLTKSCDFLSLISLKSQSRKKWALTFGIKCNFLLSNEIPSKYLNGQKLTKMNIKKNRHFFKKKNHNQKYKSLNAYCVAKTFAIWWMVKLSTVSCSVGNKITGWLLDVVIFRRWFALTLSVSTIKVSAIILCFCMESTVFVVTIDIFRAWILCHAFSMWNGFSGVVNQAIQCIINIIVSRRWLSIIMYVYIGCKSIQRLNINIIFFALNVWVRVWFSVPNLARSAWALESAELLLSLTAALPLVLFSEFNMT